MNARPVALGAWFLLIQVVVAPADVAAQAASRDVVSLTSGNRLTGEVRELSRGQLTFAIDGAGSVDIDWRNVQALESTQRLDIELASGERHQGSIVTAASDTLVIRSGSTSQTVPMRRVVRLTPIRATFRDRTAGSVDAGVALMGANDEFDLTLNAGAENRTRLTLTEVSLNLLVRRIDGQTAQRRNHADLTSRLFGPQRWFGLGQLILEENRELDIDWRAVIGLAPGRTLGQSNRSVFAVYAGVDYAFTKYRSLSGHENLAEALGAVEWEWFEPGGRTAFLLNGTTYLGLGESRTRVELASSLRRDIVRQFYWSLNYYLSYESDPPVDGARSDFGLGLTLGRSF